MSNLARRLIARGQQLNRNNNNHGANNTDNALDPFLPTTNGWSPTASSGGSDDEASEDSFIAASKKPFMHRLNDIRLEMTYFIDAWEYTKYWDLLDLVLNILFVISYVILTIYSIGPRNTPSAPPPPPQNLEDWDFIIGLLLFIQWLPRVVLTLFPYQELRSTWSITTFLSCIAVFLVTSNFNRMEGTLLEGGNIVYFYPLRFLRLQPAISRCFQIGKKGLLSVSAVKQKAIRLGLTIFSTLFLVSAWTHIVLYKVQQYYDISFLDIFYTIAVSSTSGLSTQIVPDNIFSRIVTFGIMLIGAIFLPTQLTELISLIQSQTRYAHSYKHIPGRSHVVIIGSLEIVSLRRFLREFFSADHGSKTLTTSVIMLAPYEPSPELATLLGDPIYSHRVQYIKGSAMSFRALQKAKVGSARSAFVLASASNGGIPEDAKTVMRCVSLRKFSKKLKIFAQILLPRNKVHLENIADEVVCIDEFRLGMAAQCCIAPGFATILYILTNTISENSIKEFKNNAPAWQVNYLKGATQEFYEVDLDEGYRGMRFADACVAVYKHHQALMFAIGTDCADEKSTFDSGKYIRFTPWDYVIEGKVTAYLIADQSRTARRVGRFDFEPPQASSPASFLSEEDILSHCKHQAEVTKVEDFFDPANYISNANTSLESIPTTIRSLTQKGNFDFTLVKPKNKNGASNAEEELAPAASSATPNSPAPVAVVDSFVLGNNLPPGVEKHYLFCLLCSDFPSNLIYFVTPLRRKDRDSVIVFLCKSAPSDEDWQILRDTGPNIYYIIGSALLRKDLRRASVKKASRTICFADPRISNPSDRAADSSMLLALLNIQAMCKEDDIYDNFVTVEFLHIQNMKLIGNFDHSFRDSATSEVLELELQNIIPSFCGGHVFSSSMFHSILCQAYYEDNLIAVLKMFLYDGAYVQDVQSESCFFFQAELPLDGRFVGLHFGSLFTHLVLRYKCLVLGLYRQTAENNRKFQYVCLNPEASTIIEQNDLIFAIGAQKPLWTTL